jgi:capsular exopolysaccharide synthesis family protein
MPAPLRALRQRIWVVIFCALGAAGLAYTLSAAQEVKYSATASLLFRDPQLDQKLFGSAVFQPATDPTREAATNVRLTSLEVVAARTSKALNGSLTPAEVSSDVEVSAAGASDVANVNAVAHDPELAARLANTFAQQFIAFRRDADRSKIASALNLVNERLKGLSGSSLTGREGTTLRQQLGQLKILAALQTGNAELVQPAMRPSVPASPRPGRNAIIGLVFGLLLGGGVAVLLGRLDRRIKDAGDLGDIFRRPVLGALPEHQSFAESAKDLSVLSSVEAEPIRMLRANLRYFNVDREIRSVLVTSAAPAEGKSTVALYLAAAAASSGTRTILVEADLRRPTVSAKLGLTTSRGLSQVLAGVSDLRPAVERHEATAGGRGVPLDVLPCGPVPPNPTDLLDSDRMRQIIEALEREYELVVIDTPPTSVVSDAIPLVNEVSGVLVVGRIGKTTFDSASHLQSQLENLHAHVIGVVANSAGRGSDSAYGYSYGYGYGQFEGTQPARSNGHSAKGVATASVVERIGLSQE